MDSIQVTYVNHGQKKDTNKYWVRLSDGFESKFFTIDESAYNILNEMNLEKGFELQITYTVDIFTGKVSIYLAD